MNDQGEYKDPHPEYWENYGNLQRVKHALVKRYLDGWFPKLGYWSGRVLYVDTHAGRGRHAGGELGSPLVALRSLVDHHHLSPMLERGCRFLFNLIELDEENAETLRAEVAELGPLPTEVDVSVENADSFELLEAVVHGLKEANELMAPAFVLVDPYGFSVPGALLQELMSFERIELFVNIMWRELDMAIQGEAAKATPTGMSERLDSIFNGGPWRTDLTGGSSDGRAEKAVQMFQSMTGAKWTTPMRMRGRNGNTRYMLLHFTNHDEGRKLIKECMWAACPDGTFEVWQADDLRQAVLVSPEPALDDLRRWLVERLPRRWIDLDVELMGIPWLPKHLRQVISELRKAGALDGKDYEGRWSRKANPLLFLREKGR